MFFLSNSSQKFPPQDGGVSFQARGLMLTGLLKIVNSSSSLSRRLYLLKEHSDYISWLKGTFLENGTFFWKREQLWKELSHEMKAGNSWNCYEFGVAFGYATNWWLTRHSKSTIKSWDAFDSFVGLPDSWRELSQGAFTNDGAPPDLSDSRLTWYVGDINETIRNLEIRSGPKLVLFDLDLFQPTLIAYQALRKGLKAGDLIYFDEAFDEGERLVIEQLLQDFELGCIGYTHSAVAFRIKDRSSNFWDAHPS